MNNEKYYPGPAAFFKAGPDFYIAYNFFVQESLLINKDNAFKYSKLQGYKDIEKHLDELQEIDDIKWDTQKYRDFISLLSDKKVLRPIQITDNDEVPADNNSSIAVISKDRPEFLKKTLESILEKSNLKVNSIPLTVFDDSESNENSYKNKSILKSLSETHGTNLKYVGNKEKYLFINSIHSITNIDRRIIDFAFFGNPKMKELKCAGGNRNAALLMLAGEKIISFDDDIQYCITEKKTYTSDADISTDNNPEVNFFPNEKELFECCRKSDKDIIEMFIETLGRKSSSIIKSSSSIKGDNLYPLVWKSIENRECNVKAVLGGIYGGRWFSSPKSIILNDGSERLKSYKNKRNYNRIKNNPYSLLLPDKLVLTQSSFFVAAAVGINAQDILPPFPPYGRNQDGVWAKAMLILNRDSFIAHLPYAVFHEINNKDIFKSEDYENISPGIGILTVLIMEHLFSKNDKFLFKPDFSLLSKKLYAFADIDDDSFITICHNLWLDFNGKTIEKLEQLLLKYNSKLGFWKKDAELYIDTLLKKSVDPSNSYPQEIIEKYSKNETIRLYKLYLKDYSSLIFYWPEIWNAAVRITDGKENQDWN